MKFNCDKKKQRNKRKLEEFWDTHANKWTPTFAWFPVRVKEGDCRWLETVECMWVPYKAAEDTNPHFISFMKTTTRENFIIREDAARAIKWRGSWVYRPLGEKNEN